jgi:pimeloyl-ACP methyl ester carboxylesterase
VLALCDYLGINKFTFCGHSMGGGTGFHIAANSPGRLDKVLQAQH